MIHGVPRRQRGADRQIRSLAPTANPPRLVCVRRSATKSLALIVHHDGYVDPDAEEAGHAAGRRVQLRRLPGVWDDGETVVVRGGVVDAVTLERHDGEAVMRLPRALVPKAAGRLAQG